MGDDRTTFNNLNVGYLQLKSPVDIIKESKIEGILIDLLGNDISLKTSKLNTKAPGGGAAVEWHQDWAFYPHTNDNVLALGLMINDVDIDNVGDFESSLFDYLDANASDQLKSISQEGDLSEDAGVALDKIISDFKNSFIA